MHRSVTSTAPESRYFEIDNIPTVNLGVADLNTGLNALTLMVEFFGNWAATFLGPQRYKTGRCTCCEEPRPAYRFGGRNEEWAHVDHEYAEMRHVHLESCQRDCDGTWPHENTLRIPSIRQEALRPEYLGGDPTFRDLWTYVVRHEPSSCEGYTLTITVEDDTMSWSTQTDEGWHGGQAKVCASTWCAHDERR